MASPESGPLRILGRYALYDEIAAGGMATVHLGRLIGSEGFSRTVAIKRLHPHYAKAAEFVSMFLDEARLAARIRHPNVIQTLDVVAEDGELFLVMEYVEGESLSRVLHGAKREGIRAPIPHLAAILAGALYGLHAAHEAVDERGQPLHMIHRDISPQNILVGVDGVARVLDFGVAKAVGRLQTTREGQLKGKIAYMAPEQLKGGKVDRRVDIFAAGVVLWEALTGLRLFRGDSDAEVFGKVLHGVIEAPSALVTDVPPLVDAIVLQALARDPKKRFPTAHAMARALEESVRLVPASGIAEFVVRVAAGSLADRAAKVALIEESSDVSNPLALRPARTSRPDVAPTAPKRNGTRVVMRGPAELASNMEPVEISAVEIVEAMDLAEAPPITQPSSISISQTHAPPPRRGVPIPLFVALATCSAVVIAFLALRHDDATPRRPETLAAAAVAPPPPTPAPTPPASPTGTWSAAQPTTPALPFPLPSAHPTSRPTYRPPTQKNPLIDVLNSRH